eukprot:GHVN01070087.1.p1 GENE.GHVN01070087.1~~GHVN01070087.1.p1  ORF type:complete len:161 (+),score=17.26 GHVN01070087.1:293-775(+)
MPFIQFSNPSPSSHHQSSPHHSPHLSPHQSNGPDSHIIYTCREQFSNIIKSAAKVLRNRLGPVCIGGMEATHQIACTEPYTPACKVCVESTARVAAHCTSSQRHPGTLCLDLIQLGEGGGEGYSLIGVLQTLDQHNSPVKIYAAQISKDLWHYPLQYHNC